MLNLLLGRGGGDRGAGLRLGGSLHFFGGGGGGEGGWGRVVTGCMWYCCVEGGVGEMDEEEDWVSLAILG